MHQRQCKLAINAASSLQQTYTVIAILSVLLFCSVGAIYFLLESWLVCAAGIFYATLSLSFTTFSVYQLAV